MDRQTILIVEDDPRILKALTIRLKSAGYHVVVAADGTSGVAAVVRHEPDLVLLDVSMPAGGGFFVAKNLARRPMMAGTPVIFITASRSPEIRRQAEQLGAAAFVEKPFKSEEILEVIATFLNADEMFPTPSGSHLSSPPKS